MKRQALILSSVLAALLIAVIFVRESDDRNGGKSSGKKLFDWESDAVVAFELNNFTQGFRFTKKDGNWFVEKRETDLAKSLKDGEKASGGTDSAPTTPADAAAVPAVPADPVKVTALMTHLTTLKTGEPVATEKSSVGKFQINPHSLHVVLYDKNGAELDRLYVGKTGPDFMSSFVKKGGFDKGGPEDHAIYLVEENIPGLMSYSYEQWLLPAKKDDSKSSDKDSAADSKPKPPVKNAKSTKGTQKGPTHAASKKSKKR